MRLAVALALFASAAGAEEICDPVGDACAVPLGTYRVALPAPSGDGPTPVILFLHGAGGTGRGMLSMTGTIEAMTAHGYAVLAPDGLEREGRSGGFWSFLGEERRPHRRDERAFLDQVVADAAARFDIDPEAVVLSGFSAGAFLTTKIACDSPNAFAAYAPVSGGFWEPLPERCAGPVRLLHTHGWTDATVPLEGRSLRDGQFQQGDVLEGLHLFREANGCDHTEPDGYGVTGEFHRRFWTCAEGSALDFALFPGGHGVPAGWSETMLDWFEATTGG